MSYASIVERREKRKRDRLKPSVCTLWDGDMNFAGEVWGDRERDYEFVDLDTGTASLKLRVDHHMAGWVMNFRGRDKRQVNVSFEHSGTRWTGFMDSYEVVVEKNDRFVLVKFKHDYEHLKHIRVWCNPFTPAEFQFPKSWNMFGFTAWACAITLFCQLFRLMQAVWMLPDDPMNLEDYLDLDMSDWDIVVVPVDINADSTPPCWLYSRFQTFHDTVAMACLDAEVSIEVWRWFEGDPDPWEGFTPKHGCLIVKFVDNSAWTTGTSFFANLMTGAERALMTFSGDGMAESIEMIEGPPTFPAQYYEPGFTGTRPEAPHVVFEEGPRSGIETSTFEYFEATDCQWVVGGHSAPFVNEMIQAGIIAGAGALGSTIGQSWIGGTVEALARPFYEDVILAFQAHKDLGRIADLGWTHLRESMAEGGTKAYTLKALVSLRTQKWLTRAHSSHTITVADYAPYSFGAEGYGDAWIGHRVGTTVLGQDPNTVFIDRIQRLKRVENETGSKGWEATIGYREPTDPILALFKAAEHAAVGLENVGLV